MEEHRYSQIANELGYKDELGKFAKEVDVKYITLYSAINRNAGVTKDIVDKIVARFPNVNRDWLMTGIGKKLLDSNDNTSVTENDTAYTPTTENTNFVNRLLKMFNYIPDENRTTEAQKLLAEMILDEQKRNAEKDRLIEELKKQQEGKK